MSRSIEDDFDDANHDAEFWEPLPEPYDVDALALDLERAALALQLGQVLPGDLGTNPRELLPSSTFPFTPEFLNDPDATTSARRKVLEPFAAMSLQNTTAVTAKKPLPRPVSRPGAPKPKTSGVSPASSRPKRGVFGFFYGPPGVGKTSFAAEWEDPIFVIDNQETGIYTLCEFNRVREPKAIIEVSDWSQLLLQTPALRDFKPRTVVFDSATVFERMAFAHHCKANNEGNWAAFNAYQSGPRSVAPGAWAYWLELCNDLVREGINVLILAHSKVADVGNPDGSNYAAYSPALAKETWTQTALTMQTVIFMGLDVVARKLSTGDLKAKADSGASAGRFFYPALSPTYTAKNWYGWEAPIPMGDSSESAYNNFMEAYNEAKARPPRAPRVEA